MKQQTLIVIKPDGVQRNLIGEIIKRYEEAGMRIIELKRLTVAEDLVTEHYPEDEEYMRSLGQKSVDAGDKVDDLIAQGRMIVHGLRKYITAGPVVAMVLEGEDAIALVRKVTGYTDPSKADKGTIRGDLGDDSILQANKEMRPAYNLIHASGNPEEAEKEINLWFPKS